MKLNFIAVGLLLFSSAMYAQPVITQADYQPQDNETYGYYDTDANIDEGNAGANVVWDFSNIPQGQFRHYQTVSCNGNGDCDDFAGASYFIVMPNPDYKYFHKIDNFGEQTIGRTDPSVGSVIYSEPQLNLKFPVTYLDNYTDSFNDVRDSPPTIGGGMGNTSIDAFGTLKTPVGTYTNVLRQKSNYVISYPVPNTPLQIEQYHLWYQAGIPHPIFSMRYVMTKGERSAQYINIPPNNITSTNSVADNATLFTVYPNPASASFKVNFGHQQVNAFIVRDLLGKKMFSMQAQELHKQNNVTEISTAGWAKGLYLIEVFTAEHSAAKKIIVR